MKMPCLNHPSKTAPLSQNFCGNQTPASYAFCHERNNDSKNRLTLRRGGAYYSFTKLTHEYGYGSDISLEMGNLSVGFAGADYGMLASLGDASLDSLTLETPGVSALASYTPPASEPKARIEQRRNLLVDLRLRSVLY